MFHWLNLKGEFEEIADFMGRELARKLKIEMCVLGRRNENTF